jgi:hypothetical protein
LGSKIEAMNETVIYTAIFNNYDTLKEPLAITKNCDYICFTDNIKLKSKIWKVIVVDVKDLSASLSNRRLKILGPYNELKDYKYSLYIDGTILIKSDLKEFLSRYQDFNLVNFRHPRRTCVYSEFASCIAEKKGDAQKIIQQCHDYAREGMPFEFGLSDNKIIFRNNQDQIVEKIMHEWWKNVTKYSGRDQTCLSYVLFKNSLSYCFFNENLLSNDFFEIWPHRDEYIRRIWRNLKKFCIRNRLFINQINYLDMKIKTRILDKNTSGTI